jgi:hypothetical protein
MISQRFVEFVEFVDFVVPGVRPKSPRKNRI